MYLQIILPIVLFVLAVNSKDIFDTEGAKKEWNDLSGLSQGILIVNNSISLKGFLCKNVDNFDYHMGVKSSMANMVWPSI